MAIFKAPKILHHPDRYRPYVDGYPSVYTTVPVTIELDLTNCCTHRCPRCVGMRSPESPREYPFLAGGDNKAMQTDHAADYIQQMAKCGVRGMMFTGGGEPSLHQDLAPLMLTALDAGIDVGLITHGGLLHFHDMEPVVPRCSWIRFSLDAGTPEGYQRTHGRGEREWSQVWDNVATTVQQKGDSSVTIGVGFLSDAWNIHELPLLAELCVRSKVNYLQVRPFHSEISFDPRSAIVSVRKQVAGTTMRIVASDQKYDLLTSPDRTYTRCHASQFASVICADECVYFCCHTRGMERFRLGDLRTTTLEDILNSPIRRHLLESVDCSQCPPLCRGDQVNRQITKLLDGEMLSPEEAPEHVNFL